MKRIISLVLFFLLFFGLVACNNNDVQLSSLEPDTSSSAPIESNTQKEIVTDILTPDSRPEEELSTLPPLSDYAKHIVDSGQFSEVYYYKQPSGERQPAGFTTYINKELGLIYHYSEDDSDDMHFSGVRNPKEMGGSLDSLGRLMDAMSFNEHLTMCVIDGSGEEWIRKQADYNVEYFVQMYREFEAEQRELLGEEYEEYVSNNIKSRDEYEELWRRQNGDNYEKQFNPYTEEEYENIEFWLVEYEIAGILFTGLQINVVVPGPGSNWGLTYLFNQIENGVAVVISMDSEELAGIVANRHVNRFSVIPETFDNG